MCLRREYREKVGARMRHYMLARRWRTEDLASKISRSASSVSRLLGGQVAMGVDDLLVIAKALGVPASVLLGEGGLCPESAIFQQELAQCIEHLEQLRQALAPMLS